MSRVSKPSFLRGARRTDAGPTTEDAGRPHAPGIPDSRYEHQTGCSSRPGRSIWAGDPFGALVLWGKVGFVLNPVVKPGLGPGRRRPLNSIAAPSLAQCSVAVRPNRAGGRR